MSRQPLFMVEGEALRAIQRGNNYDTKCALNTNARDHRKICAFSIRGEKICSLSQAGPRKMGQSSKGRRYQERVGA